MKIASSDIAMSGQSSYVEYNSRTESASAWIGDQPPSSNQQSGAAILSISDQARELQKSASSGMLKVGSDDDFFQLSDREKLKIRLMEEILSVFMKRRIKIHILDNSSRVNLPDVRFNSQAPAPQQGWGLSYDREEIHYESEKMNFKAGGVIKTADGHEINIDVNLSMSREFLSRSSIHVRAGDAVRIDPLVINFEGSAAQLTDTKFDFDIDADGTKDQISFVGRGSGFLALDLNQDGKINDGSELFGPKSGDGFADLTAYDEDKNGWIDENDAIFDKLRIWSKDENGNDQLFALGQKGIGAIYLGNVDTAFALKDNENSLKGEIQKTGIFLRENGTAGTIQHIDLAV